MGATHVVLIRGINVGGRNKVPMAALRSALTEAGLGGVRTYIQSGNVLVSAPGRSADNVGAVVGGVLRASFDVDTVSVTLDAATLRAAVDAAPVGFGSEPDVYHSDVAFLRPGIAMDDAVAAFSLRDGVDALWPGRGVVYFRRLSAQRTRSKLNAVMSTPLYKDMTIRNWRTTTTLAGMIDE
ncbi:DUF1697 domain-containing protein [Demequina salsinemoris]|uniref:DUF1697 domain-containing protein n=1 Tax=Demequina salsinemoris TaxID=577470 RepID=UPI000780B568|nr:DUF1697 domain-containing protein [Demequina salsinemoris]